jgi:hypothetical protein
MPLELPIITFAEIAALGLEVKPADRAIRPDRSILFCEITCSRCVPTWRIDLVSRHEPPWKELFDRPGGSAARRHYRSNRTTETKLCSIIEGMPSSAPV